MSLPHGTSAEATPSPAAPQALLPASVALQLAHPLVFSAAAACDARALVVKGFSAARIGLRGLWTGADVDVLVAPQTFPAVMEELERRGWRPRSADDDVLTFPPHSRSLTHPDWPCDLDVHFRFPGFERADEAVFEALWSRHEEAHVAGHTIAVTDEFDTLLTLVVHDLRNPRVARHRDGLVRLTQYAARVDAEALLARASELGARDCARPFLEPLLPASAARSVPWDEPSREWRLRRLDPLARRFVLFLDGTYRRNGVPVARLLAPPAATIMKDRIPQVPVTRGELWRGYARRWGRGILHTPSALWAAGRFVLTRPRRAASS